MDSSIQVMHSGTFARIVLGEQKFLLTLDGRLDIHIEMAGPDAEIVMQFPAQGCGPKRILSRMQRNPVVMEAVGENTEAVAGLINKARLEMLGQCV